jgi:hypothetical protein
MTLRREYVNGAKGHSEGIELYVHPQDEHVVHVHSLLLPVPGFFRGPGVTGRERPWDFDAQECPFTFNVEKRWDLRGAGSVRRHAGKRNGTGFLWWILPFGDEMMLSGKWRYAREDTYDDAYLSPRKPQLDNTVRYRLQLGGVPDYHRLDIRLDQAVLIQELESWRLFYRCHECLQPEKCLGLFAR